MNEMIEYLAADIRNHPFAQPGDPVITGKRANSQGNDQQQEYHYILTQQVF